MAVMAATPLFTVYNRASLPKVRVLFYFYFYSTTTTTVSDFAFNWKPRNSQLWGWHLRRNPRQAGFRSFFASSSPPPPNPPSNEVEEKEGSSKLNSTYKWCAGVAAVGLVEVSYLTYVKVFGVDAFCPVGSGGGFGGCGDVLNSDYAAVFGILTLYFIFDFLSLS